MYRLAVKKEASMYPPSCLRKQDFQELIKELSDFYRVKLKEHFKPAEKFSLNSEAGPRSPFLITCQTLTFICSGQCFEWAEGKKVMLIEGLLAPGDKDELMDTTVRHLRAILPRYGINQLAIPFNAHLFSKTLLKHRFKRHEHFGHYVSVGRP